MVNKLINDLDEYEYEAPKFLADVFESVAGAVYLDSNCSLEESWKCFYPIFQPYLGKIILIAQALLYNYYIFLINKKNN